MTWKGESRRHSLARRGIKTAKGSLKNVPKMINGNWDTNSDIYWKLFGEWLEKQPKDIQNADEGMVQIELFEKYLESNYYWKKPFSTDNLADLFLELGERSNEGWRLIQSTIMAECYDAWDDYEVEEHIEEHGEIGWECSIDYIYEMDEKAQRNFYNELNEFWYDYYGEKWGSK